MPSEVTKLDNIITRKTKPPLLVFQYDRAVVNYEESDEERLLLAKKLVGRDIIVSKNEDGVISWEPAETVVKKESGSKESLLKVEPIVVSEEDLLIESMFDKYNNLKEIKPYSDGKLRLAEYGINNTQIFTQQRDVNNMLAGIGLEVVSDITKTVLEPTSGDGAFTTAILKLRLDALNKLTVKEFARNSLIALSNIYAIEYQLHSIRTQRNNIITVMTEGAKSYLKENTGSVKEFSSLKKVWMASARRIIKSNFIYGAFSTILDDEYDPENPSLGTYRENNEYITLRSWQINEDLTVNSTPVKMN